MDQGIIQNFKVHYRSHILKKIVLSMELDSQFQINLLDALQYAQYTWQQVSPATIMNCFKHCGFTTPTFADLPPGPSLPVLDSRVDFLLEEAGIAPGEFFNIDSDVTTNALLADQEIIDEAKCKDNQDDNGGDDLADVEIQIPSSKDFNQALQVVRNYVLSKKDAEQYLECVNKLDHFVHSEPFKQSLISDYFK